MSRTTPFSVLTIRTTTGSKMARELCADGAQSATNASTKTINTTYVKLHVLEDDGLCQLIGLAPMRCPKKNSPQNSAINPEQVSGAICF